MIVLHEKKNRLDLREIHVKPNLLSCNVHVPGMRTFKCPGTVLHLKADDKQVVYNEMFSLLIFYCAVLTHC